MGPPGALAYTPRRRRRHTGAGRARLAAPAIRSTSQPVSDSILASLNGPSELRRLNEDELEQLAAEIRDTIVTTVAKTGGHLGSSLGVVEIAIALHRLLDSPRDRIVWDTGHQAYAHKLLTGRLERFGTLRQDDVSLRIRSSSLQVRATPLDEFVIRLLSPDSYRAMSELRRSKSDAIAQVARRNGARDVSVWYVSFFAVERGETRFSPREFIITNVGRDFRPLDVLPLTPGFGEQRLAQNGRQDALYVFDGQLDVQQPLTVSYTTERNDDWASILPRIERERSLVKSRASAGRAP